MHDLAFTESTTINNEYLLHTELDYNCIDNFVDNDDLHMFASEYRIHANINTNNPDFGMNVDELNAMDIKPTHILWIILIIEDWNIITEVSS